VGQKKKRGKNKAVSSNKNQKEKKNLGRTFAKGNCTAIRKLGHGRNRGKKGSTHSPGGGKGVLANPKAWGKKGESSDTSQ